MARITRRSLLAAAGTLATGLTSGSLVHAEAPGHITFITPQGIRLAFADVLVGVAGGHFKARGVDVRVVGSASSPQAVQQVISGQADIGRTAGVTLLNAIAKGGALKSIAVDAHGSPFFMISSTAQPVNGPRDLVGGVVGLISANGPSENTLDAMLLAENLDPKSVQRQYVGDNPGAYALVQAGRLRAFTGAVDTMLRARAAAPGQVVAFNTQKYMPLPGQVLFATDAAIAAQPATLVAFLAGLRDALNAIAADTDLRHTLALIRTFPVEGAEDDALAIEIIRANLALATSEGPANLLRNIPENWTRGVDLAVRAGFAEPLPNDRIFTNALVNRLPA
jgi:NitT/TauT family transport system substrate-binding protein